MSERRDGSPATEGARGFHERSLLVLGFVGPIGLTVLVLVLQFPDKYHANGYFFWPKPDIFFDALVGSLAIGSSFCIIGSFASLVVSTFGDKYGYLDFTARGLMAVGLVLIIMVMPMIVYPSAHKLSYVVFGIVNATVAFEIFGTRYLSIRAKKHRLPEYSSEDTEP